MLSVEEEKAQVCYYAWTSDSHVSVWREEISYELQEGRYMATAESLTYLDDISTNSMALPSRLTKASAHSFTKASGKALSAPAISIGPACRRRCAPWCWPMNRPI